MCNNQSYRVTPELLQNVILAEHRAAAYYRQLATMATDAQDAELIGQIHNDETAHLNTLVALYQQLTGANPPQPQQEAAQIPSYIEGVKEGVLHELRDSEFYRCLALDCHNPASRTFFDAMQDENKHAAILNYLYARSVERCCGQSPEPVVCDSIAHTVQPGESVWLIARRYAVTMEDLLGANPQITDPERLYPGQVVCIPCTGTTYTVQAGDSLWLIANRHGITVDDLLAVNPIISDAGSIDVGQVLCIPGGYVPEPGPGKECLVYLYGGTSAYYLEELANTNGAVTTVCPDFFGIDESGNLLLAAANKMNAEFIGELHSRGIRVTPFISNHWNRQVGEAAMSNREELTTQLAAAVEAYNLDGVNFDIENLTEQYREVYVDLVRRMRAKLPAGKTVSVAVAANPNGWNTGWHGSYDYRALAAQSDYLVIMAYDESYQGGPEGPVSSAAFFERSIQYALNLGVPMDQLVVAIPFFGRYWKDGEATGGIGLGARDVDAMLVSYTSTANYDDATRSARAVVTIGEGEPAAQIWGGRMLTAGTYRIWYDDLEATRYKLEVIDRYGVRGVGAWALGQEDPAVWPLFPCAASGSAVTPCGGIAVPLR